MGSNDAVEALKWHQKLFKQHWTERSPEPEVMTDTEILDWLNEYCEQVVWNRATPDYREEFVIYCDGRKTSGESIRKATMMAKARWNDAHQ